MSERRYCPFKNEECVNNTFTKQRCALYDVAHDCCSFFSIMGELHNLNENIESLKTATLLK